MAWIDVIDHDDAEGELQETYDEVVRSRGKLSNIMRIQSLHPRAMRAHMDFYLAVVFGRTKLKRADRELLATVVSHTNGCAYCTNHHAEALNAYWKDRERIDRVLADYGSADLSDAQKAMLDYGTKLTQRPGAMTESDVQALRHAGFTDEEILSINMVAGYFNFVNRMANGLGVAFSEEEVGGYEY